MYGGVRFIDAIIGILVINEITNMALLLKVATWQEEGLTYNADTPASRKAFIREAMEQVRRSLFVLGVRQPIASSC